MRTWLVTGSSAGFGREIARAAVAHGDNVVATARRPETLDAIVALAPERVLAVALDVTDRDQVDAAVAAATERFGGVDVLVNNAGHGSVGAIEELVDAQLRALMDVMYFGPIATVQAVLPGMRERGSGAIVQLSSMGGQTSMPGFGAYCSVKFALEAVSEALAAEVAAFGIDVMIVEPGAFRTEFGGGRMQRSPDSGVYDATVGPTRAVVDDMDGTQPGDPVKAAAAILDALDADAVPLHLALGDDAVDAIRGAQDARRADLDAWEAVSRATALA